MLPLDTEVLSYGDVVAIIADAGDAIAAELPTRQASAYFEQTAILFDYKIPDPQALDAASAGLAMLRRRFQLQGAQEAVA